MEKEKINLMNFRQPEYYSWGICNFEHIGKTKVIKGKKGLNEVEKLKENKKDYFKGAEVEIKNLKIDAIAVISKKEGLVYQKRFNPYFTLGTRHMINSVTKSYMVLVFETLKDKYGIKDDELVTKYLPEFKNTGFNRTTVGNVLNMCCAIDTKEILSDVNYATNYIQAIIAPKGSGITDHSTKKFILNFCKEDPKLKPGEKFEYFTVCTDILYMIMEKASGKKYEDLFKIEIWDKISEYDAIIGQGGDDSLFWGGGLAVTFSDIINFATAILHEKIGTKIFWNSLFDGTQEKVYDPKRYKFAKSYRKQWWIIDKEAREFTALGVHGQNVYVNHKKGYAVVVLSSHPNVYVLHTPEHWAFFQKWVRDLQL